jgi:hypothetical protein
MEPDKITKVICTQAQRLGKPEDDGFSNSTNPYMCGLNICLSPKMLGR